MIHLHQHWLINGQPVIFVLVVCVGIRQTERREGRIWMGRGPGPLSRPFTLVQWLWSLAATSSADPLVLTLYRRLPIYRRWWIYSHRSRDRCCKYGPSTGGSGNSSPSPIFTLTKYRLTCRPPCRPVILIFIRPLCGYVGHRLAESSSALLTLT